MKPYFKNLSLRHLSWHIAGILVLLSSGGCNNDEPALETDQVTVTSMTPVSPANLVFYEAETTNDRITVTYNYQIVHAAGARIWVQPYTNGSKSDDFLYSTSPIYQGSGSKTVIVSIDQGSNDEVKVDQLRIIVTDPDQNVDLLESFIEVDYTFAN